MASSTSGKDEPNRAMWLATRAGKMELSCPLGSTRYTPQEKFPRKPYNYWPTSFFFCEFMDLDFISVHKHAKKNLATIQPSWPHTWSVTHTYCWITHCNKDKRSVFSQSDADNLCILFRDQFSIESHKTEAKVITLTSHKRKWEIQLTNQDSR